MQSRLIKSSCYRSQLHIHLCHIQTAMLDYVVIDEWHACRRGCRDIEGAIPDSAGAAGVELLPGVEDAGMRACCDEGRKSGGVL